MHRGAVSYTLRLGLLAACVLAGCACGGDAKPLSEEYGSLSTGSRYVTDEFEPALSFEVGKGWELKDGLQQKPFFSLSRQQARARTQRLGLLVSRAPLPQNLRAPAYERQ